MSVLKNITILFFTLILSLTLKSENLKIADSQSFTNQSIEFPAQPIIIKKHESIVINLTNELTNQSIIKVARIETLLEKYPGSVEVITREDIEKIPAKDITDILKTISGLQVYKRSEQDFVIDSRGFNNGGGNGARVLLLVNGVPVKNSDTGQPDWHLIDIDEIERIEVIKGNGGVIYGSEGALASVINIITFRMPQNSYSSIKFTSGSFDKFGTGFELNKKLNNGFYNIKINYEKSDGFRKNNEYENKNLKFSIVHFLNDKTEINGKFNYCDLYYIYPGPLSESEIWKYGESYANEKTDLKLKIQSLSLGLKHQYTEEFKVSFDAGYKDRRYEYPSWGTQYSNKLYTLYLQARNGFGKSFFSDKIIYGVDLKKEDISASFNNSKMDSKVVAGYIQNNLTLFEKIVLQTGYRFDLVENLYYNVSKTNKKIYKLNYAQSGILYNAFENTGIYANWSKIFRVPTRDEIFNLSTGDLYILEPEKSYNYEIGIRSNPVRWILFNTSLFYMIVKNEIIFDYITFKNKNFLEVVHKGLEAKLTLNPFHFLKFETLYNFQNVRFTEGEYKNKVVPLSPENNFSFGISIFPIKSIVISHYTRWRDKCYVANDLENKYKKLKSFAVSDLRISYKMKSMRFDFDVYNLYNERYSEWAAVGMDYIGYYPSPGRNYQISFSFYF